MDDLTPAWRHSTERSQWEFGRYDLPRQERVTVALVTDEFLERVAEFGQWRTAVKLMNSVGSVPPPLERYVGVQDAPVTDLWAIDMGADGPVAAHRIVSRKLHGVEYDGPEDEHEVRVTACGRELNRLTHPQGWWAVPAGELPLATAGANHCGVRTVNP